MLNFEVILAADRTKPYIEISVPDETPFFAIHRFACEHFNLDSKKSNLVSKGGKTPTPEEIASSVKNVYGTTFGLISM
ncbi:hypothetical protein RCL1_005275 [Eukaryota sp. TZLM3-RCL]